MTEVAAEIVCDAGPVIHLDEVGCLDLLSDFSRVLVPSEVWGEVQRHRPSALDQGSPFVQVHAAPDVVDPALRAVVEAFALDRGEHEALALAKAHPGSLLLTDDSGARLAARALGVRSHGTIGVLIRAIRREQRTREQVLELLRNLPDRSTLHIKRGLLLEVIRDVEQP